MARCEESELQHRHFEQKLHTREWNLQKCILETTEESKCRSAEILRQLERVQLNLKELSAQHKRLLVAFNEVSDQQSPTSSLEIISLFYSQ